VEGNQAELSEGPAADRYACLDFANTLDWHASPEPVETVHSYAELAAWAANAGVLTAADAEQLQRKAAAQPAAAAATYVRAVALREAVYRIFAATSHGDVPAAGDLALLNGELARGLPHLAVAVHDGRFAWEWLGTDDSLDAMLWPVARSAAELLVSPQLTRVKQCADDRGCGYLFYDATRNRSRRWCDMGSCGNRAKARRHYQRHRSGEADA
jgi:predicted RNA-binding Zn ribbon-like protein